jgi:hypothetical protein
MLQITSWSQPAEVMGLKTRLSSTLDFENEKWILRPIVEMQS